MDLAYIYFVFKTTQLVRRSNSHFNSISRSGANLSIQRTMDTYHQLLTILIQANQICPKLAGLILQLNNGPTQTIKIIPGKTAKVKILIRWFILIFLAFLLLLRTLNLIMDKTENKLNASNKVYINVCVLTFFVFMVTAERYRIRGYFSNHFVSFVNSLFLMEKEYFKGKNKLNFMLKR